MKHTSLLAMMQPEQAPELPYAEPTEPSEDTMAFLLDHCDPTPASRVDSILAMVDGLAMSTAEAETIATDDLDLSHLEYQYDDKHKTLTIDVDGYRIECPEVITSAIAGYVKGKGETDTESMWERANVADKSTTLSRPGNRWSWSYAAFLKLVVAIADAYLEQDPERVAHIKVCRICGRTACPYHGQPDGWVWIKVSV